MTRRLFSMPRRWLLGLTGAGLLAAPARTRAGEGVFATATPPRDEGETWVRFFAAQRAWAYIDRHSLTAGERFDLMIALGPGEPRRQVRVEFFRMGPEGLSLVWRSAAIAIDHHPAGKSAAAIGPNWPPALTAVDTAGWPPGCYSADVVEEVTGVRDLQVAQVVVRRPPGACDVLVRLGTNTYQAYNGWGGHSLYPSESEAMKGAIVSFDRPAPPSFFEYDAYLVQWLEGFAARSGVTIDYATNFDVHRDPDGLDRYRLVISASHDEYWSDVEFNAFERRIFGQGGSVAFLGANAAYWQVRYGDLNRPHGGADQGRQLICYKSLSDPIVRRAGGPDAERLATARFRDGARRPETMLIGAGYQGYFDPASAQRPGYFVERTDMPLFAGTGWSPGDLAAEVVGYEWDNRDPDADGRRLFDPKTSRIAELGADRIKVLFRGHPIDTAGRQCVAEAVYFESAAGAKVFDAGSIRWAWGLGKPGYARSAFQRFNENLLRAMIGR